MTIKAIEILTTYSNGNKKVLAEIDCTRCAGNGRLENFRTIDGGLCFKCGGTGKEQKEIKVASNEGIEMIQETTVIKPLQKINDDAALKNAMIRINEEKKAKQDAYKAMIAKEEQERMEQEEDMKNNPDDYTFSWDD